MYVPLLQISSLVLTFNMLSEHAPTLYPTLDGQEILQMWQMRKDFRPQIITSNAFANDAHRSPQQTVPGMSAEIQNDVPIKSAHGIKIW